MKTPSFFVVALLAAPALLLAESMEGVWINSDPDTNSVAKIEISSTPDGEVQFVWWGKTQPADSRYGPLTLTMFGESVSDTSPPSAAYTTQDSGFADHVFFIRREGESLIVRKMTVFKDDSGRTNYQSRMVFVKPAEPDLILSALSANVTATGRVRYHFTITNVGAGPADLRGPTPETHDNLSVQAYLSKDTLFKNDDDSPTGGTVVGLPAGGRLGAGESLDGSFQASMRGTPSEFPYLILKVDWGEVINESNEDNNLAVAGIAYQVELESKQSEVTHDVSDPEDLEITDAEINGGPFHEGQTVVVKYRITNTSDKDFRWPSDRRAVRQHWIERRGDDKEISSRASAKRVFGRYAAGGSVLLPLDAGVSQPFQQRLSTAGLPVGEYIYHIEYKAGRESIQTVSLNFEVIGEESPSR